MNATENWLRRLSAGNSVGISGTGLVAVAGTPREALAPEQVEVLERARTYGAHYVFFRDSDASGASTAEALVYIQDPLTDQEFAQLHRRLWSWGGVPLVYRARPGRVDLLRCRHRPDFLKKGGELNYRAFKTLDLLTDIDQAVQQDPWWDHENLATGSLWDDPRVCADLMSEEKSAHRSLILAIEGLDEQLGLQRNLMRRPLRRRLLVLTLLIAYLEDRGVLGESFFAHYCPGATRFFEILKDGAVLVAVLAELERRFNGDVFKLGDDDRRDILASKQLGRFAALVEGRTGPAGQLSLWKLYSFQDLPVELISHVYQLFVRDDASAVYTPPVLVRLLVAETLDWDRLDRLLARNEVILDPACGSGVFLVEAYKRLILHWRFRNGWRFPDVETLRSLMLRVCGVDINPDAIELAAFSLCLAMCEVLDTEVLRDATELFPKLHARSLHASCFFAAVAAHALQRPVGALLGNPPFEARLATPGADASRAGFEQRYGTLPDNQVAYLFLHESLCLLQPGGVLCLLQQYNFLYNKNSIGLRRRFFEQWDIREVFDFISVRGMFDADTKVIAIVAEAHAPPPDRMVLHAVFRRTGRAAARQGYDLDYYDLHWLARRTILDNPFVWRSNLLGGGRVEEFVNRLRRMRTLGAYADSRDWDSGEGFIEGQAGKSRPAEHIIGKPLLPSEALGPGGIDRSAIVTVPKKLIEGPRTAKRFTAPMLLIREHIDLHNDLVTKDYLTYKNQIVGFCAPKTDAARLRRVKDWLDSELVPLRAFVLATSLKALTQKATTLTSADIKGLPYPEAGDLEISPNERIVAADIVDYYSDFIRLGEGSPLLQERAEPGLQAFRDVYIRPIRSIYPDLCSYDPYRWAGVVCQPFGFGPGAVDWSGVDELRERIGRLLTERRGGGLFIHRVTRVYDDRYIFLIKPDRLRYWLRSIALRDADETLADLRAQGF